MIIDELTVLQVCPDHTGAEVLANLLRAESIPAVIRDRSALPGLEQGSDVLVPKELLHQAKWILAQRGPNDAELTYLATGQLPES